MTELVTASEIPWGDFSGEALEELLYWLCDAMGARDLEWRAGSVSGTSPDGGRDLEATFYLALPDGELRPARWWVQAKGRTATVEKTAVQTAVFDASADASVDTVVIATNSRFSNPTRDWAKRRQETESRLHIVLWERDDLERMLLRHPSVIARVAPSALSDKGRLAVLRGRFWDRAYLPTEHDLRRLWLQRAELEIDAKAMMALCVGELANGDPRARSWPLHLEPEDLAGMLVANLINLPYLLLRAEPFGTPWEPLFGAVRYLVECALTMLPGDLVAGLLDDPWQFVGDGTESNDLKRQGLAEHIVRPLIAELQHELGDVCADDCVRVLADPLVVPREKADSSFWDRFIVDAKEDDDPRHGRIVVEQNAEPCTVGFRLDADHGCPLFAGDLPMKEALTAYETVLRTRIAGRRAELTLAG